MCEERRIEQQIAAILTNSGLPMDRRTEVAEELCGHLEQLITNKREAGLSEQQAVEAALANFGPPQVIRKQLRRQQRMLDRRHAHAEIRRKIWRMVAVCGVFAAALAIFCPEPVGPLMRFLGGVGFFVGMFFLLSISMYVATLFECQIKRHRPREEYHFFRSLLRWIVVVALSLLCVLAIAPLMICVCTPLLYTKPWFDPLLFGYCYSMVWMEPVISHKLVLAGLAVLTFAMSIALYERSRCIDEQTIPAED